jgi:hypothetical protein
MNGCKYIKERIDEAEKPDLLPLDVSEHIGKCKDCERFAIERTALRELMAAGTRVSAPINFDAVLKSRLAEVKARRSFWWQGSPGLLRLGAATAGLVVMAFAAQYGGLFSNDYTSPPKGSQAADVATIPKTNPIERTSPEPINPSLAGGAAPVGNRQDSSYSSAPRAKRGDVLVGRGAPAGYMTAEDGGVVLVRGRNGDMDVQMPTVSVGAQPLLYVSAGQRTVRNVGTSF